MFAPEMVPYIWGEDPFIRLAKIYACVGDLFSVAACGYSLWLQKSLEIIPRRMETLEFFWLTSTGESQAFCDSMKWGVIPFVSLLDKRSQILSEDVGPISLKEKFVRSAASTPALLAANTVFIIILHGSGELQVRFARLLHADNCMCSTFRL